MNFFALDKEKHLNYAKNLQIISSLSNLFSQSKIPFLHYRIMENLFCLSFNAKNLSRSDTAYDAKFKHLGVGLKTFIADNGSSIQKIAEFNKHSSILKNISNPKDLALQLATLRNERIDLANELYGIKSGIYHIIARSENKLIFFETDYKKINLSNLQIIKNSPKSLNFSDGVNEYYFNHSKSVLQRKFHIPNHFSSLDIKIIENPFEILLDFAKTFPKPTQTKSKLAGVDYVILPLYSTKSLKKSVPTKSGLNQWNAGGRKRDFDEIYIPVPMQIHSIAPNFFPPRDEHFNLKTPLNENLKAKLCQDNAKALMSNPNSALSNWLLRKLIKLEKGKILTYEKLEKLGFDAVIIEKIAPKTYSIDIMPLNSYENFLTKSTKADFEIP